ncbi:hypothetical protein BKA82DRAFT_4102876 [Pisolithus tinctorius]|nr:hypothetical protein BKA82DRAFT_4102876 [Pisolithus tinctorius]
MPQTHAIYAHTGEDVLSSVFQQLDVDDDRLFNITMTFLHEMWDGLNNYGHDMAMIPTFVRSIPDGSEKGTFLALDLGGTNLRVCEVNLHGDKTFSLRQQKYKVSDALKTGEATTLFDYLADSVDAFLTDSGSPNCALPPSLARRNLAEVSDEEDVPYIPLGLTFSFPVEQTALDSGKLLTWTKGFAAKNAIGNDVVKLLQDAFDRKNMHVRCVALVNDTVGALLSRAYTSGGCILGAIFGTGTNGAYVEDMASISKLGRSAAVKEGNLMVVNTEWGGFNNSRSALPSTPYDNKVDRESINPGKQAFEKFISGMYLGEITRNVIVSLIDAAPKPLLFSGHSSKQLNKQWGVDTAVLSEVEEAWEGIGRFAPEDTGSTAEATNAGEGTKTSNGTDSTRQPSVQQKLERIRDVIVKRMELPPDSVSLNDADVVRKICTHIAWRAARLSSCAVAAVLFQTGRARLTRGGEETKNTAPLVDEGKRIGVGVDGSLVEHYPYFEKKLRASLRVLVGEDVERRVDIGLAKDGSGVGAALCALVAYRQNMVKQYHTVYEHEVANGVTESRGAEHSAYPDSLART